MRRAQTRARWPNQSPSLAAVAALVVAIAAISPAAADTCVHFEPSATIVDVGETFAMSFRVGAAPDSIASFQLYLWFDPTVVELTDAIEGTLYAESGTMTWFIAEEEYPGFWHFFDTVFGAGTHVLPPGELLHLRFTALAEGQTPARIDTVRMTDIRREPLAVAGAQDGWIFVDPVGVAEDDVIAPQVESVAPNPFTTRATIHFTIPAGPADWRVEVFDVAGKRVRSLDAPVGCAGGAGSVTWDGKSDHGSDLPSSVYFVRLTDGRREAYSRILKLR